MPIRLTDELKALAFAVTLRISATIANEYANRCPEWLSEELDEGRRRVPLELAQQILLDAEYNSDRRAQDVGEYGMPLPIFNAYRALARQTRAAIAEVMPSVPEQRRALHGEYAKA